MPDCHIDQRPQYVIMILLHGTVLINQSIDIGNIHILPYQFRVIEQLDHIGIKFSAQKMLNRKAIPLFTTVHYFVGQ